AFDRDEVVIALLVVPDKEVLGVGLWVGQGDLSHLCHVVNSFVLRHLMPDVSLIQKGVNLLFIHRQASAFSEFFPRPCPWPIHPPACPSTGCPASEDPRSSPPGRRRFFR